MGCNIAHQSPATTTFALKVHEQFKAGHGDAHCTHSVLLLHKLRPPAAAPTPLETMRPMGPAVHTRGHG